MSNPFKFLSLLVFVCLCSQPKVLAQTGPQGACPAGYYEIQGVGWKNCAPLPNQTSTPPPVGPKWETRWGAVASGGSAFGVAENMASKRKASKMALEDCKRKGGHKCNVDITFHNQCGAMAWGNGGNAYGTAPDVASARSLAVDMCEKRGPNCKIYYVSCSYPQRVR
jgi:Domain of unknown function (DUF4189)